MTVKIKTLSQLSKDEIVAAYTTKKFTLLEIATAYNTSSRTIGRVLEECGLALPVPRLKGEAYQAMQVLKAYGLTPETLETALKVPAMTAHNIQTYLNQCTKEQLATHFYTSGLVKLTETIQQANDRKQHQAALFKIPQPVSA
jgi:hypothetical protein